MASQLWRPLLWFMLIAACGLLGCQKQTAPQQAAKRTLAVAAASDLKYAMDELIVEFHAAHPGIEVKATYGSSGNFFNQLSNKAPFDIYFSADIAYPRKLIDAGLAVPDSMFMYAVGQIVVWAPNQSKLDLEKLGMQAVADPSVKKLAIANPQHAPYGRAAEAAMKKLGVYDEVKDRLVLGENITQTAQFVESGAADIGIIALSLADAPALKDKGRYWTVPLDAYPRLEQGSVILNWAKDREATDQFRSFVRGAPGQAVLKKYGFMAPGK